jgi:hypothetical protein
MYSWWLCFSQINCVIFGRRVGVIYCRPLAVQSRLGVLASSFPSIAMEVPGVGRWWLARIRGCNAVLLIYLVKSSFSTPTDFKPQRYV